jgi:hypothetical protein
MDKIYRALLIAICAVGILFGLQYFLPVTAQYFNIKGVAGIPGLPAMPTFANQATLAPLPVITLQNPTSSALIVGVNTLTPPHEVSAIETSTQPPLPTFTSIAGPIVGEPCDNVLYPMKTDQEWLYRVNAEGHSIQIKMVVSAASGQQGRVDVYNQDANLFKQTLINCDNGAIRSFPPILGELLFNTSGGKLNIEYVSGILAPSQATFESKNWHMSWNAEYKLSGNVIVPYQGKNVSLVLSSSPMSMTCQTTASGIAAFQTISVSAGNYSQALKVLCVIKSKLAGTLDGQPISGTITSSTTQWFAPHIGLLKMQVDSSELKIFDLFAVPLNLDGQVELIHFQPAP